MAFDGSFSLVHLLNASATGGWEGKVQCRNGDRHSGMEGSREPGLCSVWGSVHAVEQLSESFGITENVTW